MLSRAVRNGFKQRLVYSSPFTAFTASPVGIDSKKYTLDTGFYGLGLACGNTSYESESYNCPITSGFTYFRGHFPALQRQC